jgi:hypothetical protein
LEIVRITVPHYFDFGEDRRLVGDDLIRPEAWDAIRIDSTGAFALPGSRADWEGLVDGQSDYAERARIIDRLIAERDEGSVASYGVGVASLELWLSRLRPERRLAIGEYAPETAARLRELFPEAEVHLHDLLADPPLDADWHLFHRIDTEFSNRQARSVFERFSERPVIVVASELLEGWRSALDEIWSGVRNRNASRSGYVRNRAALEALWRDTHDAEPVPMHDHPAWVLTPR